MVPHEETALSSAKLTPKIRYCRADDGVSIVSARILPSNDQTLPKGAFMHGTILVYGNDAISVMTRCLILGKAGYEVFTAQTFGNAMLMLMNHQIDVCVLCRSLRDEERRGISETAHALQPNTKCAVLDSGESEVAIEGVDLIRGVWGPSTLLKAVGKLLTQKAATQTM
jgi:hypothetical protein